MAQAKIECYDSAPHLSLSLIGAENSRNALRFRYLGCPRLNRTSLQNSFPVLSELLRSVGAAPVLALEHVLAAVSLCSRVTRGRQVSPGVNIIYPSFWASPKREAVRFPDRPHALCQTPDSRLLIFICSPFSLIGSYKRVERACVMRRLQYSSIHRYLYLRCTLSQREFFFSVRREELRTRPTFVVVCVCGVAFSPQYITFHFRE